jgi:hypothetical protein
MGGHRDLTADRSRERLSRLLACTLFIGFVSLFWARASRAQATRVPGDMQVELLAKLVGYDRNFKARSGDTVRLAILVKPRSAESEMAANVVKAAMGRIDRIGGLPHQETVWAYDSAASVANRCRSEHVTIVYVSDGFDDELDDLRSALTGVDVLTVAAVPEYVPRGLVLGFALEGGKSRMLLNYGQAKLQGIAFASGVLKLMRIYQ